MDDEDVELAKLQAWKDLAIAVFQAKASKWESVQAAALALIGLSLLGYSGGQITADGLLIVVGISALAIAMSHRALERYEVLADRAFGQVTLEMERLKRGEGR